MAEDKNAATKSVKPHNIIMEERSRLTVSGVIEISSFDDENVVLFCSIGELAIHGEGLHINRIDVDTGELSLEGERIDALSYADNHPVRAGLLGKLFR